MSTTNSGTPPDAGGRPARSALLALIAKWREKKAQIDTFHATMGTGYGACADELEAALAAAGLAAGDRPSLPEQLTGVQDWLAHKPFCHVMGQDARFGWRAGDEVVCNCGLIEWMRNAAVGARPATQEPEDYRTYALKQLHSALDKAGEAPASSTAHERSALLALTLERVPTLQEWNESWIKPSALPVSSPAPARPRWQPLDTAPKDGRWLWFCRRPQPSPKAITVTPVKWDASHGMWFAGTGWWHQLVEQAFTHWMDMEQQPPEPVLPEPPQTITSGTAQPVSLYVDLSLRDLALYARWAALSQVHLDYIARAADPKRHGEDEDKAYTAVRGCAKWANAFINGLALPVRSMATAEYPNKAAGAASEPASVGRPSTDSSPGLPAVLGTLPRYRLFQFVTDCWECPDGEWVKFEDHAQIVSALQPPPEVCICAAIQLVDGRIIRGHRHDDCFRTMEQWHEAGQVVDAQQQGFVTSQNRFVGRLEGRALQDRAGQPSAAGAYRGDTLFSEDLY